jgi:hypothetical protein
MAAMNWFLSLIIPNLLLFVQLRIGAKRATNGNIDARHAAGRVPGAAGYQRENWVSNLEARDAGEWIALRCAPTHTHTNEGGIIAR